MIRDKRKVFKIVVSSFWKLCLKLKVVVRSANLELKHPPPHDHILAHPSSPVKRLITGMDNNNFNARFRLFLENVDEEQLIKEAEEELGLDTIGNDVASSADLTSDARSSLSQNSFSNKTWSAKEKAIFRRTNSVLRYMIENGDIVRILPQIKQFLQRGISSLGIQPPGPAEKPKSSLPVQKNSPDTQ